MTETAAITETAATPTAATPTATGAGPGPVESGPTCRLWWSSGAVEAVVDHRGRMIGRSRLPHATTGRLAELMAEHRSAFETGWEPGPYDRWATATDRHLAQVGGLIEPLVELVAGMARVGLVFDDPGLRWLPWETAGGPGHPALFERCQVHRLAGSEDGVPAGPCRRFVPEVRYERTDSLPSLGLEGLLAAVAYRQPIEPAVGGAQERIVHLAGHDPRADRIDIDPTERAHLVLSGCRSLPEVLPAGVASATATLWPVDDQTNAITMALLHARVAVGIGPLEALRQAQLLQRALPPTVWAAYVHLGRPD